MAGRRAERFYARDLWPALVLAVGSFLLLAGMMLQPPEKGQTVAVVFAPGTDFESAAAALAEVGARPVRNGAWDGLVVANFGRPRRISEIEVAGAWLLLDPVAVGGCFGAPDWARDDA